VRKAYAKIEEMSTVDLGFSLDEVRGRSLDEVARMGAKPVLEVAVGARPGTLIASPHNGFESRPLIWLGRGHAHGLLLRSVDSAGQRSTADGPAQGSARVAAPRSDADAEPGQCVRGGDGATVEGA